MEDASDVSDVSDATVGSVAYPMPNTIKLLITQFILIDRQLSYYKI